MKKGQVLKYSDANYSPVSMVFLTGVLQAVTELFKQEENRAYDSKYYFSPSQDQRAPEDTRGKKRARAEDFL